MRFNLRTVKYSLRTVYHFVDPYTVRTDRNMDYTDRCSAGVLDNPQLFVNFLFSLYVHIQGVSKVRSEILFS